MRRSTTILTALAAVALTLGALWYTGRSVAPVKATMEQVRAEARAGGYRLIDRQQLYRLYQQHPQGLLLVDTRQEWEYRTGHIEGSVNFPMEPTWWSRWRKKGSLEKFLGPDKNRLIVFY